MILLLTGKAPKSLMMGSLHHPSYRRADHPAGELRAARGGKFRPAGTRPKRACGYYNLDSNSGLDKI